MPRQQVADNVQQAHEIAVDAYQKPEIDQAVLDNIDIRISVLRAERRKVSLRDRSLLRVGLYCRTDKVVEIGKERDKDLIEHDGDGRTDLRRTALQFDTHDHLLLIPPRFNAVDQDFAGIFHVSVVGKLIIPHGVNGDRCFSDLKADLPVLLLRSRLLQRPERADVIMADLPVVLSSGQVIGRSADFHAALLGNGEHFIVLAVERQEHAGEEVLMHMTVQSCPEDALFRRIFRHIVRNFQLRQDLVDKSTVADRIEHMFMQTEPVFGYAALPLDHAGDLSEQIGLLRRRPVGDAVRSARLLRDLKIIQDDLCQTLFRRGVLVRVHAGQSQQIFQLLLRQLAGDQPHDHFVDRVPGTSLVIWNNVGDRLRIVAEQIGVCRHIVLEQIVL